MRITYQITLAEGQVIAYEIGEDTEIDRKRLDEVLDLVGGAAERRKAIFDLPLHKTRLLKNREQLERERKGRANAEASMHARVVQMTGTRRNQVPPAPMDVNAVSQFDNRISALEATIREDELRIPYLEAVAEGREPPELRTELDRDRPALAAE